MAVEWGTVAVSILGSGGLATVIGSIWTTRAKNAVDERIAEAARQSNERIAEGNHKAALLLARDETLTEILTRVSRQATDATALAHNATIEYYGYDTPLGELRSYANHTAEVGEDARTEADAYTVSKPLGDAVAHLRSCQADLTWAGQNQYPDRFDENDPLITELRTAAEEVQVQVLRIRSGHPLA